MGAYEINQPLDRGYIPQEARMDEAERAAREIRIAQENIPALLAQLEELRRLNEQDDARELKKKVIQKVAKAGMLVGSCACLISQLLLKSDPDSKAKKTLALLGAASLLTGSCVNLYFLMKR